MEYVIGVDIGTTSVKTVLYDEDGNVKGYSNNLYPLYQDTADMAEEDPEEIFSAMIEGLNHVLEKADLEHGSLKGVSYSCAMHSVICLDENYKPLTRAITWADNRAVKYADELKENGIGMELYKKTGVPTHPMTPLTKIMWLRNEKPDIYKKTRYFVGIKEYINYKLFGELKEDYSIANATGLFNIFTMDWDDQALEVAGVTRDQLPKLVDTTYQFKGMVDHCANMIGINKETPFVIGASDGPLANLGVDAIQPGVVAVTIGTSGAVRVVTDKPTIDSKGRVFCYYLSENMWVVGGPVNNGGIVFRWVRDQLCLPEKVTAEQMHLDAYDLLTQIAAAVPAGSDGLIFLPFLGGERAPIWDADARGTFFGLTRKHTRANMIRAALEGIVYNLYTVMLALEEVVGEPKKIQATGGFARSKLWRQMLADIFEQDVNIPESFEGTALGAATLGMYSLGMISSLYDVSKFVGVTNTHKPNPKNYEAYRELIPIYIRLSRYLKPEYKNIATYQRKHANDVSQDTKKD
ncbi:gluconokinase [Lactobacillus sanfranciscensis]|uniref:Gluconokinase n=1 Tax=Fructilactobacillus sanfranciscensis (strain TMW 1.1304) TaxID=714313 RepID=G2KVT1_FRUST|nr:gluconokinase [Fructilactobacillus sanfranciscensis]AEN99460.1 Gluconokinase [Fructilactobacillus sanfranciscensis TMW 1.1304]NDR76466.1 gluconokinase [Fructilactobacillus sanfranciscensis]NDR97091.1 gluconokinase [Fructilactobacillus sanfranciscensis]NDS04999.1 gluconokinase [Fructilactobacillus sanfranciscensis]POH18706.1 gluconokinase [Fructilactobacillus sanfranciscensis]